MSCSTFEERRALNEATPCEKAFVNVFPVQLTGLVAPGILLAGMTIIGYGISANRPFIVKHLPSLNVQLGIISLLVAADHASSYFDHSRISNEPFCLTAAITGDSMDSDKGRLILAALSAALAAFSTYSFKTGSITTAATGIPFSAILGYLAWSPGTIQSCKTNAIVTGLLAGGLDIMTLVGVLELIFAKSGNKSTKWHLPLVIYATLISGLFVALVGKHSEYGERVSPEKSCVIDDEQDLIEEKATDRSGELWTGILLSVTSVVFFLYLNTYDEVSGYAMYPVMTFLLYDIIAKIKIYKRGEPLVSDATNRTMVYSLVQILDVLLSSASLLSIGLDKGMIGPDIEQVKTSKLGHSLKFGVGSLSYIAFIGKIAGALVSGAGGGSSPGAIKMMAESVKLVGLNVVANLIPFFIDALNMHVMSIGNPRILNNKCFVR